MWELRQILRAAPAINVAADKQFQLGQLFTGWKRAILLQATARMVRAAGRERKIQKVKQVLEAGDILFRIAKCVAPKTPKRRIQLRDSQGRTQAHAQEHLQILEFFRKLCYGRLEQIQTFDRPITFCVAEILRAISKMSPSKVMPSDSAPTVLWKHISKPVAHILLQQFHHVLQAGQIQLPPRWNISELVLLPKPGKSMRAAPDLRPICTGTDNEHT